MRKAVFLCLALLGFGASAAVCASSHCRVEPFRNASTPQGADATMRVRNTGAACRIRNYGASDARQNPAESGSITQPASHGKATYAGADALYVPDPGFIGEDTFVYQARARNDANQSIVLTVRVKVLVMAP